MFTRLATTALLLACPLQACSLSGSAASPLPAAPGASPVPTTGQITSPSGLQYTVLAPGSGTATARAGDQVTVNYTGWLTNGTKFDSSFDRQQPFGFTLGAGQVIKGWDEGVAGMKANERRRLIIPPALGYGASGTGPIPANATLVFEVELLSIDSRGPSAP